jgi:hypothetical protein
MNATFHFSSAQELTPAILEVIRQTYQEQPVNIYIEAEQFPEQIALQPDDDLRSAITMDELKAGIFEDLETFFASKK